MVFFEIHWIAVPAWKETGGDEFFNAISEFFDGCPVPAFAIDADHVITHWNKACEYLFGLSAAEMVGTRNQWRPIYHHQRPVLADLIVAGNFENIHGNYYNGNHSFRASPLIPNSFDQ